MSSDDEILNAIKSIDRKIGLWQSREEREKQHRLMGYSIILAAILSTLIFITFRIVELMFSQSNILFILLILAYFLFFIFAYYYGNVKKLWNVGDYVIEGRISPFKKNNHKILDNLCEIAKNNGECKIKNVQMSGLMKLEYIYKTFNEDYVEKMNFISKNIDHVKSLDCLFGNSNYSSLISISFTERDFMITLSTKHFEIDHANEILYNVEELEKTSLILVTSFEGF